MWADMPAVKIQSVFSIIVSARLSAYIWPPPWDFFGRNDAKAETPVLWPPHEKSWLIGKNSDAGRDWGQEEKGTTKDEMAGWHQWLDGHESEWTSGDGDEQGGLACYNSWGCKESDMTERLTWTDWWWLILCSNLTGLRCPGSSWNTVSGCVCEVFLEKLGFQLVDLERITLTKQVWVSFSLLRAGEDACPSSESEEICPFPTN